jgi:hypothetical protein
MKEGRIVCTLETQYKLCALLTWTVEKGIVFEEMFLFIYLIFVFFILFSFVFFFVLSAFLHLMRLY